VEDGVGLAMSAVVAEATSAGAGAAAGRMLPSCTTADGIGFIPPGLYVGDKYFSGSERKRSLHFGLQKKY
jgi:hypothetical protein